MMSISRIAGLFLAVAVSALTLSSATARWDGANAAYERGDYQTAFRELMPLAVAVDTSAQFNIGIMYANGDGVQQNYAEAARWYRRAADQGHAGAQNNLGALYERGEGVPQNHAEAASWYRLAAEQGLADALYNLGVVYHRGQGVPRNYVEAVRWYRLAAVQGYADAQHILGLMYSGGMSVPQNHAEAVRWYRRAANQGHARAQRDLGMSYAWGEGVLQDDVQAYKWLNLAAARSADERERKLSAGLRDEVAARLTPAERARGQELARNWRPTVAARSEGGAPRMATLEGASHDLSHAERSPWGSPVKDSPPTDGQVPPQQPPEREVIGPAFPEMPPPHPGQLTASGRLSQKAVSRAVERALMFGPVFDPGREQIAPAFSDLPQAFPERQPGFGATAGFVSGLLSSPPVQAGAWLVETIRELEMDSEPGYDPFLDPQIKGFEDHMGFLIGARSHEQMANRIHRLRKRQRLEEISADSPTAAFVGSITIVAAVLGVALGAWAGRVKRHREWGSR